MAEMPWESLSPEQQAVVHNLWHVDLSRQMHRVREQLDENTATTTRIKTDTSELRELMVAFKGAMRVLDLVGKAAKPLGYIAALAAGVIALWPKK